MTKKELELLKENQLAAQGSVEVPKKELIEDAEWCFQFFNNEPVVFGWQAENTPPSPLVLQIQPTEGDVLTFRQNGMEFKIFARPLTEESKKLRKEQEDGDSQN